MVVGMQSDFCVRATCSYALGRGNSVFLVEVSYRSLCIDVTNTDVFHRISVSGFQDAHATYDRPEAYAAGGPVQVTEAAKVEKEIESELEEAGVHVCSVEDLTHVFADEDS